MARDSKATGRRSILVAVGVLLLIALFAVGCGSNSDDSPTQTSPAIENVNAPEPQVPETAEVDSAESKSADPVRRSSFIPQDDLASIPADRFFTTSGMNGLTPEEPRTTFGAGEAVYVYAGINAPTNERIQLRWYGPDGEHILPSIYKNILANTGDIGYRIYTYRIFRQAGPYKVQLFNSAGVVIGETRFEVISEE